MPDTPSSHHAQAAVSDWIQRWSHLLPPGAQVLDVACGAGRHTAWFAGLGHAVTGIDRDLSAARSLLDANLPGPVTLVQADIENGPWPLSANVPSSEAPPLNSALHPMQFDVLVVTNYLWRPLFPVLLASLRPGGLMLYETFAQGNETVGRPSRPDFLLQSGELLRICASLEVIAYENGFKSGPERFLQRIVARAPILGQYPKGLPNRHQL